MAIVSSADQSPTVWLELAKLVGFVGVSRSGTP